MINVKAATKHRCYNCGFHAITGKYDLTKSERRISYKNGKIHNDDGPAITYPNGIQQYYIDGKLHREDGPAEEWPDGTYSWFFRGEFHRLDGPAIQQPDGTHLWFIYGKEFTEAEWEEERHYYIKRANQ